MSLVETRPAPAAAMAAAARDEGSGPPLIEARNLSISFGGIRAVDDVSFSVAKGEIFNFLTDVERVTKEADTHLTEIMMAQDFHDLTGQVIARVVNLAATIEDQLVQLLIQTAPPNAQVPVEPPRPQHPVRRRTTRCRARFTRHVRCTGSLRRQVMARTR